jgi:hypothetical protein
MTFEEAIKIAKAHGYTFSKKLDEKKDDKKKKKGCSCCGHEPCTCKEDKLEEAKRIVMENGLKFVKNSIRNAGNHPVFNPKEFQEYLLKECGTGCDDKCCEDIEEHNDEVDDVIVCPDCDGDGCKSCDFNGYIEK